MHQLEIIRNDASLENRQNMLNIIVINSIIIITIISVY